MAVQPVGPVAIVPAAPLLLPELTGTAPGLSPLREAVEQAIEQLTGQLTGDGTSQVRVLARRVPGSLAGFGARCPTGPGSGAAPGWVHELGSVLLRGHWSGPVSHVLWTEHDRTAARAHGAGTAAGTVVLADLSRSRGPRAPMREHARAEEFDASVGAALSRGQALDVDENLALEVGANGLPLVRAAVALAGGPWQVLHEGAPAGVGYVVAVTRAPVSSGR